MATLTETAYYTRNAIKWGAVGVVVFIILRLLFSYLIQIITQALPPAQLKPNNYYGKLPALSFPPQSSTSGELQFTLQTVSGALPEASAAAYVYFMPKEQSNLLSLSEAQAFVSNIGFTSPPRKITETAYRWTDVKNPLRSIEMNIVSNHFTYSYSYVHDLTLFTQKEVPTSQQAISEATNFLQSLALVQEDIDFINPKVQYLALRGNTLTNATSQSTADAVEINFYRKNINGTPVVTENPEKGIIRFILSGSRNNDQRILLVEYRYWPIDVPILNRSAIYALKTSDQMWKELIEKKAYYASLPISQTSITITDVFLAYYDGSEPQLFLQPVMVFRGENNFQAYISAVTPEWTQ